MLQLNFLQTKILKKTLLGLNLPQYFQSNWIN